MQSIKLEGLAELLEYTDVLIDGEYIDELYDESRGIVGSSILCLKKTSFA